MWPFKRRTAEEKAARKAKKAEDLAKAYAERDRVMARLRTPTFGGKHHDRYLDLMERAQNYPVGSPERTVLLLEAQIAQAESQHKSRTTWDLFTK